MIEITILKITAKFAKIQTMRIDLSQNKEFNDLRENFSYRPRRRKKRRGFLKFLIALAIALLIIATIVYATVRFAVGPVVKSLDALPADFPQEIALYQPEQAKITMQTATSRDKIAGILKALPDWLLKPFLNYLSDDLKNQLVKNFGEQANMPQTLSLDQLKNIVQTVDLSGVKTLSLSWPSLDQSKEELAAFYKDKLAAAGFQFKENLADYDINLGFWKENVFGNISLSDDKKTYGQTRANMLVNYLEKK